MKKLLILFLCFISASVFSQESVVYSSDIEEVAMTRGMKIASFPKGMIAFRETLAKNFRTEKIKGTSNLHCDLYFIIDKKEILQI